MAIAAVHSHTFGPKTERIANRVDQNSFCDAPRLFRDAGETNRFLSSRICRRARDLFDSYNAYLPLLPISGLVTNIKNAFC